MEELWLGDLATGDASREPWSHRVLTQFGIALDTALLRGMERVVDALLMPPPEELSHLRASADELLDAELQEDPGRFFRFPDEPPAPLDVRERSRRSLPGGVAISRELAIAYRPYAAERRADPRPASISDRILVEHWMHETQTPRPTLVALHGFTMGRPRLDALALLSAHWFRHGLDVALLTLPHHGARTSRDARFSGEYFAVPHVARLSEAVRQAIYEMRLLVLWLRERTGAPVGVLGLSLGGYLSALLAGLYDDLDFVVPMVPPVCFGDLAWRFFRRSRHYPEGPPPAFSREELRAAFRPHSPLAHTLRVPRERLFIVAGRGDRIVPPEHPSALWRHWGEPAIHWFNGGHLTPFGRRRIVGDVVQHLKGLDIL